MYDFLKLLLFISIEIIGFCFFWENFISSLHGVFDPIIETFKNILNWIKKKLRREK